MILTQLERPIFSLQTPNGGLVGQEFNNSYAVQGATGSETAVVTLNGSLPSGRQEFSLLQVVSENGEGLLEAVNIRGRFEAPVTGGSAFRTVAIVEGAVIGLALLLAAIYLLQSSRRAPASRF